MRGCGLLTVTALLAVALPGRAAPAQEEPLRLLGATRADLVIVVHAASPRLPALQRAVRAALPGLRAVVNVEEPTTPPANEGPSLEAALTRAGAHLVARLRGTSPFRAPDRVQSRRRLVLLVLGSDLSDEELAAGRRAAGQLRASGITTLVVGADGHAPQDAAALAVAGGSEISSASGAGLAPALVEAVFSSVRLEYASGPGIDSLDGTVVLLPSFEHPGWKGHLRAVDLAARCRGGASCHASGYLQLWDARERIDQAIARGTRRLYTGSASLGGGAPIPIAAGPGPRPCISGTEHAGCGGKGRGVRDLWPAGRRPLGDGELAAIVAWLVRRPLGPFIRSVPARVGPPPSCAEPDHAGFAAARRSREPLVYAASSDGILHALRARTGEELFGWVPAELWPMLRVLRRGRDESAARFVSAFAGSPRVEDIRSSEGWRTELTVRLATEPEQIAAIDVSDPTRAGGPFIALAIAPERASRMRRGLALVRSLDGACTPVGAFLVAGGTLARCDQPSCLAPGQTLVGAAELRGGPGLVHPPAVLLRAASDLTLAALSGSAHQPAGETGASRIFLRRGQLALDLAVDAVCRPAPGYLVRAQACGSGAPPREALPVAAPLLLESRRSGAVSLFALYVEPDPARSWLVHVRTDGRRAELQSATPYSRELTGLTVVAGGQDLVFSAAARAARPPATLVRVRGGPLSRRPTSGSPILESLREVP